MILWSLAEFRRLIVGWSLLIGIATAGFVAVYHQVTGEFAETGVSSMPDDMRGLLGSADQANYLELGVYGLLPPLLLIMCAIGLGARGVAGLEESGSLDLLLAGPLDRRRLVLARFTAVVVALVLVGAVAWAAAQATVVFVGLRVPAENVLAVAAGLVLAGLVFGALAFAVGAVTGDRAVAVVMAGGLAAASYVLRSLTHAAHGPDGLRWLSPVQHYLGADPVRPDWPLIYEATLLLLIAGLAAVGVAGFARRDVGSAEW